MDWVAIELSGMGFDVEVLDAFIVGSEARRCAKPDSDIDIAVIIPPVVGRTSLQVSEAFHELLWDIEPPHWSGRVVDFQFFYENDPELAEYERISLA